MSSKCPYCNKMVWFGVVRDKQLVHRRCLPKRNGAALPKPTKPQPGKTKEPEPEPEPDIYYLSPFPHYSFGSFYSGAYRGRATPTSAEGVKEWIDRCEAIEDVEIKDGKFRVIGFILERK